MYRFGFIGGTKRGYELLNELLKAGHSPLIAFILNEDQHEEEKYSVKIEHLLKEKQIQYSVKRKLSDTDYKEIEKLDLDFIVVFGWRTLIDTKINSCLKTGMIAAHYSLLPRYRGFAPVQWAMINGERETGVTLFLITEGEMDSGKIIAQRNILITDEDYVIDVENKLLNITKNLFLEILEHADSITSNLTEQNESDATYTCKRIPEDGKINWSKTSVEVNNLIRALSSTLPRAFCSFKNEIFHVRKSKPGDLAKKIFTGRIPGRVVKIDEEGVEVLCGNGSIKILEWESRDRGSITNPNADIKSITETLR